jgi:GH15 family glucan-1,4-alpha-glucosidase
VGENERGHDLGREAPHALLRLTTPVGAEIVEGSARMRFVLREDETVDFALQYSSVEDGTVRQWNAEDIPCAAEETLRAWTSWADMHQSYEGPREQLVHHSGRVLQGLTYYPTGAMIAAPTTSLPEVVGGGRNWDYRFCWVRDASFTLDALWVAACPDEAEKFFSFLPHAALGHMRQGTQLQVMFGIGGEHDLAERELTHLGG